MSNVQVQLRRGTTAQHAVYTGPQGELTVDTDKNALVLHDGATAGGKTLDAFSGANEVIATGSTTARSLEDRFADVVNVLDYGATGDGATDDTDAIKAAITAADAGIFIPAGTYIISSSLVLPQNFTIQGAGKNRSVLKISPSFTQDGYLDSVIQDPAGTILPRIYLRDFTIDGQGGATVASAIKFSNHYDSVFENIYIRQSTGHGFYLQRPVNGAMNNCYINSPAGNGIRIEADAGTGQFDLGNVLLDNGGNNAAVRVTQTSQNKFSLFANAIRAEGGWSHVVHISSYTTTTDNAIFFKCNSIRAEKAPNASATNPTVFKSDGRTMYGVSDIRLGGTASGWTYIADDTQRGFQTATSPVIGLLGGNWNVNTSIQVDAEATPNIGGRVGFSKSPSSGIIDAQAGDGGSGASTEPVAVLTQKHPSFTGDVLKLVTDRTANTAYDLITGFTGTSTLVFRVAGDGDVENTNNSYGALSDKKLKENIIDSSSQWADIKAIKVRNYNLIGSEAVHLGVIAQELETSGMNGLVKNILDDPENPDSEITKSVKYSVLYMKAIKALQEAMDRIEVLEAKVETLQS